MLLPLILDGAGRLSLDHLIDFLLGSASKSSAGAGAWGLVFLVLGGTVSILLPWLGAMLAGIAVILLVLSHRRSTPSRREGFVHIPHSNS